MSSSTVTLAQNFMKKNPFNLADTHTDILIKHFDLINIFVLLSEGMRLNTALYLLPRTILFIDLSSSRSVHFQI
jgi:hypothetical protein